MVVGVHYASEDDPYNENKVTRHFIVIVGKGYDREKRKDYFRYYEVGSSNSGIALSTENKFYLESTQRKLAGTGARNIYYTVTEIRRNK